MSVRDKPEKRPIVTITIPKALLWALAGGLITWIIVNLPLIIGGIMFAIYGDG
jgi:hypothetical protein